METKDKPNRKGVTWDDFSTDVANKLKHYFLLKVSKSQSRTIKSMWRQGCDSSDAVSYVLLSSNPVK